jgi:hypothetical protein
MGQNTHTYEIKTSLFSLGQLNVTQTKHPKLNSITYKLESSLKVWSIYKIDYLMEALYSNDTLINSITSIKVNEKSHHLCTCVKTTAGYKIQTNKGYEKFITKPIIGSITPLYFNMYSGPDSIFTEYSGEFLPFVQKNCNTFILNPSDPMEFIFNNKHITKVIIHHPIMDFFIELKEITP